MLAKHKLKPVLYSVITIVVSFRNCTKARVTFRLRMGFVRDGLRCVNLHADYCENIVKTLFCAKNMV